MLDVSPAEPRQPRRRAPEKDDEESSEEEEGPEPFRLVFIVFGVSIPPPFSLVVGWVREHLDCNETSKVREEWRG